VNARLGTLDMSFLNYSILNEQITILLYLYATEPFLSKIPFTFIGDVRELPFE